MKIASLEYKFKGCFILEENCNLNHNVIIEGRCKLNISGVNEVLSFDDETIIVSSGTQVITVTHNGEPYKVEWRKGLKSLGQMKNNANILTGYTEETEKHMTLELTEAGYYTILLTTQGRDTYRLVIYVEE